MTEATGRVERRIVLTSTDKRMTVRELRDFVRELEQAEIGELTEVKASVTFSGYLRKIEV